ncbi:acyltransferase domain-containing protein [Pseudenhygromyxa sp. WMMC2535]|uniref:type I polyketide synthase n=1 Tax=Pseudenhygromyxa sp. WMMC2535 TaxID=2712867 RepID=UPI0015564BC2|nr:type I polyketide synthase [Pseudenhygromyxa sp. WMMC2535]NVB39809.1 acyltransferase domain-containing protein [Pseudenhygromyxa sp. WMMC2535]
MTEANDKVTKALRASLKEVERLRKQNKKLAAAASEPIAVVAMACRMPGGVETPEQAWALLDEGRDAITPLPEDRGWPVAERYDPDPERVGAYYTTGGGFLDGTDKFDAALFGISPREAEAMDPQHRLLLELSWEALERAKLAPMSLRGSDTGVFVGVCYHDFEHVGPTIQEASDGYKGLGIASSVASGRIAYTFGFEGPALSVDTACSTSLVAAHLACQALRRGECSLALTGGATIYATLEPFVLFSRLKALSPDGRCRAFSDQAAGAGWAEGGGVLVLERLSDAKAKGHPILALIPGSAINQDGRSQGLTAPNGPSQQRVIRQALASAKLEPSEVDAVEAHGTGTGLGDPIEVQALQATYGRARPPGTPLRLGTLKSNIGHSQAAAGVLGIIKVILSLQHERLPKTLHAETLSPHVDWDEDEVAVLREAVDWPRGERPRRAGVSSFGISGTNAHVLVEEAPLAPARDRDQAQDQAVGSTPAHAHPLPLRLSGHDAAALDEHAKRVRAFAAATPERPLAELAAALHTTRTHLGQRATVIASSTQELVDTLTALERGEPAPRFVSGRADLSGKVVFVFPGQGSQWPDMAKSLLASAPVFADAIAACDRALAPHVDWSLLDVLHGRPGAAALSRVDVVQPALFAMMVALAALWRSLGVEPDAVIGHSQGEIAAACVAGALSLEDAAKIVALRSRVITSLAGSGAMAATGLSAEALAPRLTGYGDRLSLAVDNGPASTVVSGDPAAVDELVAALAAEDVFARRVQVDYASHCAHIESVRDELLAALASLEPKPAATPIMSTVTQAWVAGETMDADYWYRNLRQAVSFAGATTALLRSGHRFFVEVSPHPVMPVALAGIFDAAGVQGLSVPTLRREDGELERVMLSLGELLNRGCACAIETLWQAAAPKPIALPTYPFQRQRFWPPPQTGHTALAATGFDPVDHPLLVATTTLASGDLLFTAQLDPTKAAWLGEHAVFGHTLIPATAFLELALAATDQVQVQAQTGALDLEELTLEAPLIVQDARAIFVQLTVASPDEAGVRRLAIHARVGDDWVRNASGSLVPATDPNATLDPAASDGLRDWPPAGEALSLEGFYAAGAARGFRYGPSFEGLREAWRDGDQLHALVELPERPEAGQAGDYLLHPALFDAALHPLAMLEASRDGQAYLPFSWSNARLFATGASTLRVTLRPHPSVAGSYAVQAVDAAGQPVARVDIQLRAMSSASIMDTIARAHLPHLRQLRWQPVALGSERARPDALLTTGRPLALEGVAHYASFESLLAASEAPQHLLLSALPDAEDPASTDPLALTRVVARALAALLDDERFAATRVCLLTSRALQVAADDDPQGLAAAGVWGLVRSLQTEHPERRIEILDIDVDVDELDPELLAALVGAEQPQLTLRRGQAYAPRLDGASASEALETATPLDPAGTVLITGAFDGLAALVAKRLVSEHGARHLLLAAHAPAETSVGPHPAEALAEALRDLGAEVALARCDLGAREALAQLLDAIDPAHPLTALVHRDAPLPPSSLSAIDDHLAAAFRLGVEALTHLDALTRARPLVHFVLLSSSCGTLGAPRRALRASLDTWQAALCAHRRALGLPATSLAWGPWADPDGPTGDPKLRQAGVQTLSALEVGHLFDAALAHPAPSLVPLRLDASRLGERTRAPQVLRHLIREAPRAASNEARSSFANALARLGSMTEQERVPVLVSLLQHEVAAVMSLARPEDAAPDRPFRELGLDSLMAVELRNRLQASLALHINTADFFTHPTPLALAQHYAAQVRTTTASADASDDDGSILGNIREWRSYSPTAAGPAIGFMQMFHDALRSRQSEEFWNLLSTLAKIRKQSQALREHDHQPLFLSRDERELAIYCTPSLAVPSTPLQYTRLADAVGDRVELWAAANTGYAPDERLPSAREDLVRPHVEHVQRAFADKDLVLLGYSSGGWLAFEIAAQLAAEGTPAKALILLDAPHPDEMPLYAVPAFMLWTVRYYMQYDSSKAALENFLQEVTAMHNNVSMYASLALGKLELPTLFVHAVDGYDYEDGSDPTFLHPRESWPKHFGDLDFETIHATHFHLVAERHVDEIGEIIKAWLERRGLTRAG